MEFEDIVDKKDNTNINPFPNDKFFDSSKLKDFADDNFKFDENGRKFFKGEENTVGKGEIACYVSPFPTVFSKDMYCKKPGLIWKRVNPFISFPTTFFLHLKQVSMRSLSCKCHVLRMMHRPHPPEFDFGKK